MLTVQIIKDQVFKLIDELSDNEQKEVLQYLIEKTNIDLDDTADEIVIEGIKQGLKEALTGQTIPLSEMWVGIGDDSKLQEAMKIYEQGSNKYCNALKELA